MRPNPTRQSAGRAMPSGGLPSDSGIMPRGFAPPSGVGIQASRVRRMSRRAWLAGVVAGVGLAGTARAQGGYGSPVVGTWSTTLVQTDGQPFASIFIQFRPDGRYQKRMIVRGGTVDTFGSYQFDPQQSVIHYRAEDYQPRNLPPVEPMGQWISCLLYTSPSPRD